MIKYDINVPGHMSEAELEQISIWAGKVPKNGVIVELGSLYGRSSICWAMNCDPSVTIYCIDDFYGDKYDIFVKNTTNYKNIIPIRGLSPHRIAYPGNKIDIFFMDADHTNPGCFNNLIFFKNYIKPNGIMCGHDYNINDWPDVVNTVLRIKKMYKKILVLHEKTSLWSMEW